MRLCRPGTASNDVHVPQLYKTIRRQIEMLRDRIPPNFYEIWTIPLSSEHCCATTPLNQRQFLVLSNSCDKISS